MPLLEEVLLELDEVQAIRLADAEGLYQEQAARQLGVSGQTFGDTLNAAHRKLADALLHGKALRIAGALAGGAFPSRRGAGIITTNQPNSKRPSEGSGYPYGMAEACRHRSMPVLAARPTSFVHDPGAGRSALLPNGEKAHAHGLCHPLQSIASQQVDVVLCSGIGRRALDLLEQAGVQACQASAGTADGAIRAYRAGTLAQLDPGEACQQHHCD